jgi:hypothetical protein
LESLTPRPGIREQNLPISDSLAARINALFDYFIDARPREYGLWPGQRRFWQTQ